MNCQMGQWRIYTSCKLQEIVSVHSTTTLEHEVTRRSLPVSLNIKMISESNFFKSYRPFCCRSCGVFIVLYTANVIARHMHTLIASGSLIFFIFCICLSKHTRLNVYPLSKLGVQSCLLPAQVIKHQVNSIST